MINNKGLLTLALLGSLSAHAGTKKAATALHDRTRGDLIKLSDIVGDVSVGTYDRGVAIVSKTGNVVGVWFDGPSAKDVYDSLVEASQGNGEEVSALSFDLLKNGVLVTGGAAKYVTELGLGAPAKLASGTTVTDYTLVPLLSTTQDVADSLIEYVEDSANAVVTVGEDLKNSSNSLIRSVLYPNGKQFLSALGGIAVKTPIAATKAVVNAGSGAVNAVSGAVTAVTGFASKAKQKVAGGSSIKKIPAIPKWK